MTRIYADRDKIKERVEAQLKKEPVPVTQKEIDGLPPSLKAQLAAITRMRKVFKLPDNLKEREIQMVRYFRGY